MIVSRTPYRVSLFGGGTDYPGYFQTAPRGGAVLGFALNQYCYLTVRRLPPYFDHRYRVVWSRVELARRVADIEHPAVRAVLERWWSEDEGGLEITHAGDLPARSGVGSSSSFVVGLMMALARLRGQDLPAELLAERAIVVEQSFETVGCQDQVFAAYGGLLRVDFGLAGFQRSYPDLPRGRLEDLLGHLLLFYTGEARSASEVAAGYDLRSVHLDRLRCMVDEAYQILVTGDLAELGPLLDEGWRRKRELAPGVSTLRVDLLYDTARRVGATGGKLLGAGGGGFFLLFAPPERHALVRAALTGLVEVPVGVDWEGSRIVVGDEG